MFCCEMWQGMMKKWDFQGLRFSLALSPPDREPASSPLTSAVYSWRMAKFNTFVVVFALVAVLHCAPPALAISSSELAGLSALLDSFNSTLSLHGWNSSSIQDPCNPTPLWGLTCSTGGNITALYVRKKGHMIMTVSQCVCASAPSALAAPSTSFLHLFSLWSH